MKLPLITIRGKLFLIFVINSLVTIIISGLVINSFLGEILNWFIFLEIILYCMAPLEEFESPTHCLEGSCSIH